MKGIPPIKALMTPFPYWIESSDPIARAREMMEQHSFRHLPVMREGRLAGVVSDRDLRAARGADRRPAAEPELRVGDVCASAYVVDLDEPLDNVLLAMADRHIDAALVVRQGKLVGIFTMTDACRSFGEHLRDHFHPPKGDDAA